MSEFGDFLKQLRGDLSLREAAKRSGLSYSYISSLESGKHPRTGDVITPSPETLKALSTAYKYDYEELMQMAGHLPATPLVKEEVAIYDATAGTTYAIPKAAIELSKLLEQEQTKLTIEGRTLSNEDRERLKQMIKLMFANEKATNQMIVAFL